MSGQKIIDGLKEAVAGNFARVTIDGQIWQRVSPPAEAMSAPTHKLVPITSAMKEAGVAVLRAAGFDGAYDIAHEVIVAEREKLLTDLNEMANYPIGMNAHWKSVVQRAYRRISRDGGRLASAVETAARQNDNAAIEAEHRAAAAPTRGYFHKCSLDIAKSHRKTASIIRALYQKLSQEGE